MSEVLLDEDEQEAIVEDCRAESQSLERTARLLLALVNGIGLVLVAWSFLFFERSDILMPDNPAASSTGRVLAYSSTLVAIACALLITIGSEKRMYRLVGGVAACVPIAATGPRLVALRQPLAAWWIAIAGPVSFLLSVYVDLDMNRLSKDVTSLSGLKYKYKKV